VGLGPREETKKNISLAATGRVLTEEDKKKISYARTGIKLSDETRAKISAAAKELRGVHVRVTNINTKEVLEFASLTDAAKIIGVSRPAIKKYLGTGKPVKQEYLVEIKK
jgi:cell division protein FtsI/penicillin-binding protein 2